mgnify:CR=1 FL=1
MSNAFQAPESNLIEATEAEVEEATTAKGYQFWSLFWRIGAFNLIIFGPLFPLIAYFSKYLNPTLMIQIKPSVVSFINLVAIVIFIIINGKGPYSLIYGKKLGISDLQWRWFSILMALSLIFPIISNLYVAFNFSEKEWVEFKLVVLTGYNLLAFFAAVVASKKISLKYSMG